MVGSVSVSSGTAAQAGAGCGSEGERGVLFHPGEGTVPVDKNGQALSNCILWMDMRGAPYLKKQLGGLVNIDGASIGKVLRFVA